MFTHSCRILLVIKWPSVLSICDLSSGVLLLNAVLTVRVHQANSHKDRGWETFTDAVVHWLSNNLEGLVFMLWGSYAQKKGAAINRVGLLHCRFKPKLFMPFMYLSFCLSVFVETPPRPAGCASFSPVCTQRILWVRAFLKGQRAANEVRKVSCKLEGTLSCYACFLTCTLVNYGPKHSHKLSQLTVLAIVCAEISLWKSSCW